MPAAAVTPAPIAYIKVVAVKKLVVGCLSSAGRRRSESRVRDIALWSGCQSPDCLTVGQHRRSGDVEPCGGLNRRADLGPPVIVGGAFNRVSLTAGNVYFEQIRVLKAGAFSPEYDSME